MKHDDFEKRVSSFIDGALRGPKREQLERELDRDPRLARQVERSRALGRLVRESWNEGPAAPAPDYLLAAIRPVLAEIDRERSARPAWERAFESFVTRFVLPLRPSPALATAAAFAFVAALTLIPRFDTNGLLDTSLFPPNPLTENTQIPTSPVASSEPTQSVPLFPTATVDFSVDGSSSVYDASPGHPAVLWRGKDGSQTLWLIDQGDLSSLFDSAGGWG